MIPPSKKQRTDGDAAGVALDAGAEAAAVAGDASGDAMMAEAVLTPKAAGGGVVSKAAARVTPSSKAAGDASAVRRDANAPELEEDHPEDDKREQISEPVGFNVPDTTLNAMVGATGGMVMSINEGGLSYLLAGARANVGIRSGRYAFEARIVEMTNQAEPPGQQQRSSLPRNLLRIGFSVAGSMPLMGDTEESVCFDSEGSFHHNKKRSHVSQKFGADVVVTVVLNMRETGPNAMTVSLFKDGVRVAAPQPIPEVLRGKTLYPTVTFKNVSVQVNWGPRPFAPLPFRCRMLQDAALEDVEVLRPREPEDGKFNILFPVCLPDNGTFHWCDWFLSQNPHYTEISDRRIIDWAVRSGIWRPRSPQARLCNDRPDLNLGLPSLEDGSAKRTLITAAATQRRDIVIMEVRGNLMKTDRMLALRPFKMPHFRRLAWVMAGQSHFDLVMEWMARVALNLELAVLAMAYLIDTNAEGDAHWTAVMVLCTVVLGSNLMILPYQLMRRCEVCGALATLYLLMVAYSPSVFLDRMTYYPSFMVLMVNHPVYLGLLGIMVEIVRKFVFSTQCANGSGGIVAPHRGIMDGMDYTPMYSKAQSTPRS
mmetsp:Transcript_64912/g.186776  ORF Transcript_64912/g.186776 Transcript_64912/m.186776 type:complete len:595 (+) Transcript_64912:102-1886(+)